ncbi:nickel pincer cofactor biosynthesis protein LarC [Nakamurella leprariae]|uniref:Pyridinium-3,5-bisthiocarboxylic acid mononucleotide nickel insertion protein n=1 Tax=Nakamurella leprariae TaxID=2803911 RepID=A0A939BZP3_9ACTN|nr:nickel pincer cofactor biosynthesis protein LarC [Nakamurella leprariae]MBM9467906.1 nickel pincer cofactor biosynthesis protein LarC [Nakamurella leprariae]
MVDPGTAPVHAWIDASAGVAGDMLLGALLDVGADRDAVQRHIDAVLPGSVRISAGPVTRAGLRATKADVDVLVDDPPHRTWRDIRARLVGADLPAAVRDPALAVFARLAEAEGRVHGIPADRVHFHEVGALDSIADVVGTCAALHDLGVDVAGGGVTAGVVAVGSGRTSAAHGDLPVPVPAVAELSAGWQVRAGGQGELATPTGMALVTALARTCTGLPPMSVQGTGIGAGTRDTPGRPNVVRVVLGVPQTGGVPTDDGERTVVLEANVDDLDPRLWPGVLAALLRAGALDAWLTPMLMKKGRPAHTVSVLGRPDRAPALRDELFRQTTTIGIRQADWQRFALPRAFVAVQLDHGVVAVKIAHRNGEIVRATPEFDDVAAVAERSGRPVATVLAEAVTAASAAGLRPGEPVPAGATAERPR